MKLLKKVFIAILILIGTYFIWMLTLPAKFEISRSIEIQSAAKFPFELVNDHKLRPFWSPWDQMDPNMKRTYNAVEKGKGSKYFWEGNDKVGVGSLEIMASVPFDSLKLRLNFLEPFESESDIVWKFSEQNGVTQANWTIMGKVPFAMRWLILSMEEELAPQLENGLELMKTLAEQRSKDLTFSIRQEYVNKTNFLSITKSFDLTQIGFEKVLLESLEKIYLYADSNNYQITENPLVIFHEENKDRLTIECGFPFKETVQGKGNIIAGIIGGEIAVTTTINKYQYQRPYAYEALDNFIKKEKVKFCCSPYEVYIGLKDDFSTFSPQEIQIYIPV